jgi:hypothetical protein
MNGELRGNVRSGENCAAARTSNSFREVVRFKAEQVVKVTFPIAKGAGASSMGLKVVPMVVAAPFLPLVQSLFFRLRPQQSNRFETAFIYTGNLN